MAQHYSDPKRASDPYSLPDVETFQARYGYCEHCDSLCFDVDSHVVLCGCDGGPRKARVALDKTGWFYWFSFPGCMPDSEPFGPYDSEADALCDMRASVPDDGDTADTDR